VIASARMEGLDALHRSHFGRPPELIVRSPGRINLIGDHTDYCGLPVLPMAIGPALYVAAGASPKPGVIATSTLDRESLHSRGGGPDPPWGKYVLAALGVLAEVAPPTQHRGAVLAIDGDLPATGGLSSSSALTVGCLLALGRLWELDLGPDLLVELAVRAERRAAIAGGTMDQTVITFARPGHALRIDFDPPDTRHVAVPGNFVWVAGYSGSPAPKGTSAAASYNSFVLASRAAAVALGDSSDETPRLSRVRDASDDEVAALPAMTVHVAAESTGGDMLGLEPDAVLDLAGSARHVLAEARRVDHAEAALDTGDSNGFGRLMNESHASLREYGASTPLLDRLVDAALAAGAVGGRLTGAGFGGWAVALAPPASAQAVRVAMEQACGGPTFFATAEGGALCSSNKP